MYKAMVIDDEEIVRWGIRDLIDWEAEGFELCEDGHDGRDGLKKLLLHKPDLALVDIKMPGRSGIELIRAAREAGFAGHFVILTGYSEFEFAKAAISLGVEEYLLKPVDEDELCGCARKVREELDGQLEETRRRNVGEEAAREEVLRKVLLRMDPREELEKQAADYRISFGNEILCAAILADPADGGADSVETARPSGNQTGNAGARGKAADSVEAARMSEDQAAGAEEWEKRADFVETVRPSGNRADGAKAREKVTVFRDRLTEFLRDSSLYQEKVMMDGRAVLIRCGEDYTNWAKKLSARNERMKAQYGSGLLIAVGNNVGNWYELCYSYQFAKSILEQEFLLGHYDVLSIQSIEEQQMKAENPPAEYFLMLAEVGDLEGIQKGVEKYRTWCIKNLVKESDVKVQVLYNLMSIRNAVEKKYGFCEGDMAKQLEQLGSARQLEHVMELYTAILQDICINIGRDGSDTIIKRMYYYMEKNYGQDMKLESFARMFNYNANYLGKMFRKEVGDSFNNILDSIRITNAKRMLEETDKKVYQISEDVGYNSIDYFYLKFKKYVGISPKEYQKEISERQKSG